MKTTMLVAIQLALLAIIIALIYLVNESNNARKEADLKRQIEEKQAQEKRKGLEKEAAQRQAELEKMAKGFANLIGSPE
jgi:Skp family chaperone for outer membrane proteins